MREVTRGTGDPTRSVGRLAEGSSPRQGKGDEETADRSVQHRDEVYFMARGILASGG